MADTIVTNIDNPSTIIIEDSDTISIEKLLVNTTINDNTSSVTVEVPSSSITTVVDTGNIVILEDNPRIVTVGLGATGPQGEPGIAEEDIVYAKQTDFVGDTDIYKGEAVVGSALSSSVWRIRKLVISVDGDVSEKWASGNANFDKIWDNRLSLSYT